MREFAQGNLERTLERYKERKFQFIKVHDLSREKIGRRWKFVAHCECICGNTLTEEIHKLTDEYNCGCVQSECFGKVTIRDSRRERVASLMGEKRGMLEIVDVLGFVDKHLQVKCKCDCGDVDTYVWSCIDSGRINKCKNHFKKLKKSSSQLNV